MKKKVHFIKFCLLSILLASCVNVGSQVAVTGENVTEISDIPVSGSYSALRVKGPFNIVLFSGSGLRSNMGPNILERITFSIEGNTLEVVPSVRFFPFPSDQLIIYVGVNNLRDIALQVDGQLFTDGILRGERLALQFDGTVGGIVNSDILNLSVMSRSSGRIVLVGSARNLTTEIYGSATLSLRNFRFDSIVSDNEYGSQILMPR